MLIFRPYKNCDAKTIVTWIDDEKTFYLWSADVIGKYPISADELNDNYEKQKDNANFMVFTACNEENVPVGHMIMRFLDEEHKKLRFGFIIVDGRVRGKGYGKEMLLLAQKYAFEFLHVDEISLGVFVDNSNAMYCYKSVGFAESGELTKYNINNEEWECMDLIIQKVTS
ncbi:GNAT family N-acetyltransferase [Anaerosporobacter sp.]|uniref:GNAT family N-acetyltransferase n=1 Tax=Anaerosporobacter sp. TaxID=1872529 RepID=UPI00286F1C2B|nr:GNAT family protein [Anaerosporobacter sp.]